MEDKHILRPSNFLIVLSFSTLFFAIIVTFFDFKQVDKEFKWRVSSNDNKTELFLDGGEGMVLGADIYLENIGDNSLSLGDFYPSAVKVRWDNEAGQYSFFVNPAFKGDSNVNNSLLISKGNNSFKVLPNSLIYVKDKGGVHPKIK